LKPATKGRPLVLGVWLLASLTVPAWLWLQDRYPSRPIRIIATYQAGSASDVVARAMAAELELELARPVVVVNVAGAAGLVGTGQAASAAPDGYTLVIGTPSSMIISPSIRPNADYHLGDFVPVAGLAKSSFVITTSSSSEAPQTASELVERLRWTRASFSSAGIGTVGHLCGAAFLSTTGAVAAHVPYKGSVQSLSDVAAGTHLFACDTISSSLSLIRAGRLRPLVVTSRERVAGLPDTPTASEAGIALHLTAWLALFAPLRTPPDVVARLERATLRALSTQRLQTFFRSAELEPWPVDKRELQGILRVEVPFWQHLAKRYGIQQEK
jgi:tripartite-type tricarboxylate transporter receptor subunit TctC